MPDDEVYGLYQRGLDLLERGHPAAAATVLQTAAVREPEAKSLLEALGRAQFDARDYRSAQATFRRLTDADPVDDYAQFGCGLAASRSGQYREAVEHLALAVALRPGHHRYRSELRRARSLLAAS